MRTFRSPLGSSLPVLPARLRRRRVRAYEEWKWLREWGRLPHWEDDPPGYLMRQAREQAGLSQEALASRLDCSQQAVSQAERWDSNPTVAFLSAWAVATGGRLRITMEPAKARSAQAVTTGS